MRGEFWRRMLVLTVVVALLFVGIRLLAEPVQASLGNRGVPVRCSVWDVPVGESRTFDCVAGDGTPFTPEKRVPDPYYLLVTDIVVSPDCFTTTSEGAAVVKLYHFLADDSLEEVLVLVGTVSSEIYNRKIGTFGTHFTTPYLVLPAGDGLSMKNLWASDQAMSVFVSGLLVTNVSYLPLAVSN